MSWTVRFTAEAERQAEALDPPVRRRIATRLAQLADNPKTAANVKALANRGISRCSNQNRYVEILSKINLMPASYGGPRPIVMITTFTPLPYDPRSSGLSVHNDIGRIVRPVEHRVERDQL